MLLGLTAGHKLGLALFAGLFIGFALLSALVIPRRRPEFPGQRLGWFIVGTVVLFVAMLGAVETFAKEPKEEASKPAAEQPTKPVTKPPAPQAPVGDPAAGKALFSSEGCGGCHTFSAAGTNATVGPNLDTALKGKDAAFVRESIVNPNKEIAKGYPPNVMPQNFGKTLSPKQIDDLVAFLTKK